MTGDAPFVITATDKSGSIAVAATLFMSWMVIVCLIRLYMRLTMNGPLGMDDWAAFSAGAIGIAHVVMIMNGLSHGLGRSHQASPDSELEKAGEVCILYGKSSVVRRSWFSEDISLQSFTTTGREKVYLLACKTSLLITSLWCFASILAVALSCPAKYLWSTEIHCRDLSTASKAITAFDVLTEALLVPLSVSLVWALQLRRKDKMTVVFAFGTRIVVIILTIVRQSYLNTALQEHDHPLSLAPALIATEALLHFSIMLATVPCLKPFIVAFNTGWGQGVAGAPGTSYYKKTETSASQAHLNTPNEENDLDVAMTTQSLESYNSQQLIIHQTQEWSLREELEMRPIGG
ncbi:uncharacterized protein P174DRAFT_450504 [Aspergillus novofumigatus IBT 16806]|uniref:Rhodopsin domain-containing protein n=1 Tax=Aspergillus novofumigatus (strain IBT 16806) TaxID=1392255 RepID=A0A2I1CF15_ASPN1|nr:uncharacterized protein P174DRAFT_450504 [Aspergillus novofumigatus IBT 16806]PKX96226.1 hypothetical protein P174DRAFT_450504 [Aspergillus novofumigatus IBT 16806]